MQKLKRNKKWQLFFLALFVHLSLVAQDKIRAEGVVMDEETAEPLIGVTVVYKGSGTTGTVTDLDGYFSIEIPKGATLTFNYIGFQEQKVVFRASKKETIYLKTDTKALDEVVVVGYGSQKKNSVTGAISGIKSDELLKSPTGDITGSVAGRIPGLILRQPSGQPGANDATFRIRGISTFGDANAAPLVLVDGVERSFHQIDPEEIETFSVLKDAASTAVYGIRGGNGVILITTKRGKVEKTQVSYTANFALQSPTRLPKIASSYDYARYYNQAYKNDYPDDSTIPYPDAILQKYLDGSDPILYPNMNWTDEIFEKTALQNKHNVNVSGGTGRTRYYVSVGYFHQDGLQKNVSSGYGYNNKDSYRRINVRSNIDMSITSTTQLALTVGVSNGYKTRIPDDNTLKLAFNTPPNSSPGIVDGKYVFLKGRFSERNPLYELTRGIREIYDNHADINLELTQNLNFITQGLTLRGKVSYDDDYTQQIDRTKTEQRYFASPGIVNGEDVIVYTPDGEVGELGDPTARGSQFKNRSKRMYGEVSLNYNRTFADDHNISALFVFVGQKKHFASTSYSEVPTGYLEYVGRLAYNYKDKYMAEFNMGINGSENFTPTKRYGYFPAASIGWIASNESFFKKYVPKKTLSFLKLRASYGEVGNDKNSLARFYYAPQKYSLTNYGFQFGESAQWYPGYSQGDASNPFVSWETSVKQNYAIESKFLDNRFFINFDYFKEKRRDILITKTTAPFLIGFKEGTYNIGKTENKGYELELGWNQSIKDFSYYLKGNYSFARNKVIYKDEILDMDNPQKWATGRRINEIFGYVFDGFFNTEEEIANSPSQFGVQLRPGDVKYKDLNGDGIVDSNDISPLMNPTFPEITFGISGGVQYKGFDMSFLFQGADNVSLNLGGNFQKPFDGMGSIMVHSFDSWSPDNMDNPKYPRLSTTHSQGQNYSSSSIWYMDASYIRLKNVEIGYTFSKKQLEPLRVLSSLRVYLSGQNLYVWDKLDGITDPENKTTWEGINYPQLRVFNCGVSMKF